ncbi:MAG: M48 family metalloprotease [Cyanobacteriota bacterium]|nr:M48 family metalloprotease [Cyanobacteriota bacterium]
MESTMPTPPPGPRTPSHPNRAAGGAVKLAIARFAGSLALASTVTLSLIGGMVLVLSLATVFILNSEDPRGGLVLALGITVLFNLLMFFLSPWLMDLSQKFLYRTQWTDLESLRQRSPETATVIERICTQKGLKQPRLGLIDDQNPTAFTYGSLPNTARIVVSEGLFTYLSDEEIAAVYAHELGHIIHWDFAIMTLGATMIQICYLFFVFSNRLGDKAKEAMRIPSLAAYIFYIIGTYLLLYLSRIREYYADHFSSEVTGNPNALSRALVKIAYGIVEEAKRSDTPSQLLAGTRALGISDSKTAVIAGTAYRVSTSMDRIGKVFLWDMFNPWAGWMELNSTHPLTGKRIRALSNYAEQLDLTLEFDMASVMRQGQQLSKQRLYSGFLLDVLLYSAEVIGVVLGVLVGFGVSGQTQNFSAMVACPLIGAGIGMLIKAMVLFPNPSLARTTEILDLFSDPYASPLRGLPAELSGTLIGRGQAGFVFGSNLQFQDATGLLFLRYASRFGSIGNALFGMKRVHALIGSQATVKGWFRRGVASSLDLLRISSPDGSIVNSYPRFWTVVFGGLLIILGLFFLR